MWHGQNTQGRPETHTAMVCGRREMAIGVALHVAGMLVGTGVDWVFLVGSALPVQP